MKIAKVIGTVTLARAHPAMSGATLRCVEELSRIEDLDNDSFGGETIVAWNLCGAGVGDLVAMAEGPEAAQPFRPDVKPLDASLVALLDDIHLT